MSGAGRIGYFVGEIDELVNPVQKFRRVSRRSLGLGSQHIDSLTKSDLKLDGRDAPDATLPRNISRTIQGCSNQLHSSTLGTIPNNS
jgi:hypothetical protein